LISGDPSRTGRVDDCSFLLVSIFNIKGFHRGFVTTFNKIENTGTPECRDHECFPDENILPR
jgi:hypothetical protein